MGSRTRTARRVGGVRDEGTSAAPSVDEPAAVRRELAHEAARQVGWEFHLGAPAAVWDAPFASILSIDPRRVTSVPPRRRAPTTVADIEAWLVAPVLATLSPTTPWDDFEIEQTLLGAAGEEQHFKVRARPFRLGERVAGCAGIVADVTAQRRFEATMQELVERYERLVELSPDGIIVHQDGRIVYANRAALDAVGMGHLDEGIGRSIVDFLHPDSLGDTLERIARLTEEAPVSPPAEATLLRLDGSPWLIESVSVLTRWHGAPAYQVILRDLADRRKAEAALRYQASLVAQVSDAIIGVDPRGVIESWNSAATQIYGREAEEAVGRPLHEVLRAQPDFGTSPVRDLEAVHLRADGSPAIVRASVAPMLDHQGRTAGSVIVCADTTERRLAEQARRQMEQLHSTVVAALDEGIVVTDERGRIVASNPAAHRLLPFPPDEGRPVVDVLCGPDGLLDRDEAPLGSAHPVLETLRTGRPQDHVLLGLAGSAANDSRWLLVNCRPLSMPPEGSAGVVCSFSDVTDKLRAQHELAYRATHDELTGLANRAVFVELVGQALGQARRTGRTVAVLYVDIDRFKRINDLLGHASGDEALRTIARRLEGATREMDTVARISGDEFAVLLTDLPGTDVAIRRAETLRAAVAEPLPLACGWVFSLQCSIGVAFAAPGTGDAEPLLRDADIASYRAKDLGGERVEVFDEQLRLRADERQQLELALRRGLEQDLVAVHYQPIVSAADGRLLGLEALARFDHPERGPISPSEFIPVAEESGLIIPLGTNVLRQACTQVARWRAEEAACPDPYISVNLSARQLFDPALVDTVAAVIRDAALDPSSVWLEITESVLMEDADAATRTLLALRDLGVHLAIDDFGTGYSSLTYLRRFPVEMLKIDRTFIEGVERDLESQVIVQAVVGLARALNLGVVAEGVERPGQLAQLRALGCDVVQGFLTGRPRPARDIIFEVDPRTWEA